MIPADWWGDPGRSDPPPAAAPAGMTDAHRNLLREKLKQAYWYYLGHLPGDEVYDLYTGANATDKAFDEQMRAIEGSDEAQLYYYQHGGKWNSTPPGSGAGDSGGSGSGGSGTPGSREWIADQLKAADSTDDASYWERVIAADPKVAAGDASAIAYWVDRIKRGDGAAAVRNGTLAKFQDSGGGGATDRALNPQEFTYPEWQGGDFQYQPWQQQFVAPTMDEARQEPGYEFQLAEGQKALERSSAARGTLLTPQMLKELERYQTGLSDSTYQNVYNRKQGEYSQKYGEYLTGRGNALQEYQNRYGQYADAYSRALQTNAQNYGQASNAYGLGMAGQQQNFSQLFNLAQLSSQNQNQLNSLNYNYAQLYGQNAYAGTGNNYYDDWANANAAGRVGSANAWMAGLGGAANAAQQAAYMYGSGYRQPTIPGYQRGPA